MVSVVDILVVGAKTEVSSCLFHRCLYGTVLVTYVPGTVLSAFSVVTHLILITTYEVILSLHFTEEETKEQRG